MKRKNLMSDEEAEQIYNKLKAKAKPSAKMQKWINDYIMRDLHMLFQYRAGKERWGYCSHCHKYFSLEIKNKRTVRPEDRQLLEARHKDKVICPKCGYEVTKRYAGIRPKDIDAIAAEFKVGADGELLVYIYTFRYPFSEQAKESLIMEREIEMEWEVCNIAYFDLHKYFHMLYGYGGPRPYFEDRFTGELSFDYVNRPLKDLRYSSEYDSARKQGVKSFGLFKALKKSNLKYCCLEEYAVASENDTRIWDILRFFKFYCSYPEITERMIKQGFGRLINLYLCGYKACKFNFSKKTVHEFLGLKKEELAELNKNSPRLANEIAARQFVNKKGIVYKDNSEREWLIEQFYQKALIEKMLKFYTLHKVIKYCEEQVAKYAPCSRAASLTNFFIEYEDYLKMAAESGLDLNQKGNAMPQNVYAAHDALVSLKEKAKIAAEKEADKKFRSKYLKKYNKKYSFEKDGLLIRPASGSKDLYIEAQALHHCVYANYRDSYRMGNTVILLIRHKDAPEKPFYTLEYRNGNIIQCRGYANCGTTNQIDDFIKSWREYLKQKQKRKVS